MSPSVEDARLEQVVQRVEPGSKLLRTWELKGGVSAQVTALEAELPGGATRKMVVRRHGAVDLLHNPNVAADEFKLMQMLYSAGLAVPAPYYLDQSGEIFPTPYVVIKFVEGQVDFAPSKLSDAINQLAAHLARIHRADCSKHDLSFLPNQAAKYTTKLSERPAMLDDSLEEGRIRDALSAAWPLPEPNASVLLHGDYWPGNTWWRDGRLVAVIDWEDAQIGDPLGDLANSRLEMLWAFGVDAMHSFTEQYASMTDVDFANLPYWDLCAALRPVFKIAEWAGDAVREQEMRKGHRLFVAQAFEALSTRSGSHSA